MGVTIHYRGQLTERTAVYSIIEEVKDIAQTMGWQYHIMDESWATPPSAHLESGSEPGIQIVGECGLKGIQFKPHERCEPVWLYFNAHGMLTSPFRVALDAEEGYPIRMPWIATKTQFGGIETHITVVKLLQYLQQKYLPKLEVEDEGGYWDTGNVEELKECFDTIEEGLQQVQAAISGASIQPDDTVDEIVRKIEDAIRRDDSGKKKN
ncbi:MAG: hypothetical protein SFU99_06475 [Saprospiraceae bacterium]|nr:hypothetical protein [Saprospiraceae bacterium]